MRPAAFATLFVLSLAAPAASQNSGPQFLVIVVDGLRQDYVTPDVMPNLHHMGEEGVFFERHHAVIPTVTRVNSASFATGSYPETHGLMGNSVYFPSVDPENDLNTSDYENLLKIREAEGRLLTATTIGEVLDASKKQYLVLSSGSTGSSYLLNPELNGAGIINVDVILPEALRARVDAAIGPAPEDAIPATARVAWTVDAYIKLGLDEIRPDVTFIWMTEPDHTAHAKGIGAPETVESLQGVDEQIGRIRVALKERDLDTRTNIMITSDHGFSTHVGGTNLGLLLRQNGFADGVHVAGNAIYVDGDDPDRVEAIANLLRAQPTIGPIFSAQRRDDPDLATVPGTIPYTKLHWQHARSADLLVFPDWNSEENEQGFAGFTFQNGVAGHGSTSVWDVHNTLIAVGPSFKRNVRSDVPSANVDIAPTILWLLNIEPPATMTGRPLTEAVVDGPLPSGMEVESGSLRSIVDQDRDGSVALIRLDWSDVNGHRYIDSAGLVLTTPIE